MSELFELLVNENDLVNQMEQQPPASILFDTTLVQQEPEEEPQQPQEPEPVDDDDDVELEVDDDAVLYDAALPALPQPEPLNVMQINNEIDEITLWFTQHEMPELASIFKNNGFKEIKFLIRIKTERLEKMNLNMGQLTKLEYYLKKKKKLKHVVQMEQGVEMYII